MYKGKNGGREGIFPACWQVRDFHVMAGIRSNEAGILAIMVLYRFWSSFRISSRLCCCYSICCFSAGFVGVLWFYPFIPPLVERYS